ncbi:DUF721 domain-containing protein [Candidatus Methylopumilus turicensis]|nr:DUF721 domain-containing protein [Candidatus Methylopumilus turicensis]
MQLINAILKNSALSKMAEKAKDLTSIQKIWNEIVPTQLKPYSQAGNIEHKRLTVHVENGAIAAKIKLLLPSLITKLQKQGVEVTSIRVQVDVQSKQDKAVKPSRHISENASTSLQSLAKQLEGSELGDVLTRLSKRT